MALVVTCSHPGDDRSLLMSESRAIDVHTTNYVLEETEGRYERVVIIFLELHARNLKPWS
jgi:hypothetical protein